MNPVRHQSLLAGQSAIAKKIHACITADPSRANTSLDIATEVKRTTGSGVDLHTLRGCLNTLVKAGLVREVVPGSFRQVTAKEKPVAQPTDNDTDTKTMAAAANTEPVPAPPKPKPKPTPMDALGSISARLRSKAQDLIALADEIDAQAIAIEDRRDSDQKEVAKVRQLMALMKELA